MVQTVSRPLLVRRYLATKGMPRDGELLQVRRAPRRRVTAPGAATELLACCRATISSPDGNCCGSCCSRYSVRCRFNPRRRRCRNIRCSHVIARTILLGRWRENISHAYMSDSSSSIICAVGPMGHGRGSNRFAKFDIQLGAHRPPHRPRAVQQGLGNGPWKYPYLSALGDIGILPYVK